MEFQIKSYRVMKLKLFFSIFCILIILPSLYSQTGEGYWDNNSKIEKYFILKSSKRVGLKVNVPIGTSQIIYRISFLKENDFIKSTSTLLASIPNVYSKTISGILETLNNFGGDNKGQTFLFKTYNDFTNYTKNNLVKNTCYQSSKGIPCDKQVFILNQDNCLSSNTTCLYFAFTNCNYFDTEKIFIEVVFWVDNVASRGWTKEIKENLFKKWTEAFKDFDSPLELSQCLLDKLQADYKYQDFLKLSKSELDEKLELIGKECLNEVGQTYIWLDEAKAQSDSLAEIGNYGKAIQILLEIIDLEYADANDYNNVGFYYIMSKQYLKAIKYLKEGEILDETNLFIKGNLAHAYLLNGDYEIAKAIYLKYNGQNVDEETSWVQMIKEDFETFKKHDILSINFNSILSILK